jgi:hypothetical protein
MFLYELRYSLSVIDGRNNSQNDVIFKYIMGYLIMNIGCNCCSDSVNKVVGLFYDKVRAEEIANDLLKSTHHGHYEIFVMPEPDIISPEYQNLPLKRAIPLVTPYAEKCHSLEATVDMLNEVLQAYGYTEHIQKILSSRKDINGAYYTVKTCSDELTLCITWYRIYWDNTKISGIEITSMSQSTQGDKP